jgi:hypothetical protein
MLYIYIIIVYCVLMTDDADDAADAADDGGVRHVSVSKKKNAIKLTNYSTKQSHANDKGIRKEKKN